MGKQRRRHSDIRGRGSWPSSRSGSTMEETRPVPETLLEGESRDKTPAHCLSPSVQTQPPIDPTQIETSQPGDGSFWGSASLWLDQWVPHHLGFCVLLTCLQHFLSTDLLSDPRRCSGLILFFPCSPPGGSSSPCSGSHTLCKVPTWSRALLNYWDLLLPQNRRMRTSLRGNSQGPFPTL